MSNGRNIRLRGRLHDYTVGYGKPPKKNRFKKGDSGNPRGRPKGAKSRRPALPEERLKAIVLNEAYRTIDMREGDRTVSLTMAQAIIRALNVGAAKGQFRAQRLATEMLTSIEREDKAAYDAYVGTAMNYKFAWEQELERRKKYGITDAPQPLPASRPYQARPAGRHRADRWSFDEGGEGRLRSLGRATARIAGEN